MLRLRSALLTLATAAALGASATSDAATDGSDAVARGLDLFIHAPNHGAPGDALPVQILAYGFPTVVTLRPLEGAAVEAVWDPESLGKVSVAPPPVRVTTDASGRARLDMPIPDGPKRSLRLLLGVRLGDRQRTQTLTVERRRPHEVEILVPDTNVVPGSAISAWVRVQHAATGQPAARTPVEVSLLEGGVARYTARVTTDAAGTAMTRVPIPWTEEPAWRWELRARTNDTQGESSVSLRPREETPGTPQIAASWGEGDVRAGDRVNFTVRIRDGAGKPVAALAVRTWVGPKGTSPPEDKEAWEKVATLSRTDAAGEVRGSSTAPTTVVQGVGTTLRLVARATFEGHELSREATVAVENPASTAALLPEGGAIVPGIEQRLLLRVRDARGKPVEGSFTVEGDGLRAAVTTDAFGEAELAWSAPVDLGALRNVGPCAGGVAAAVRVRPAGEIAALASRREPFELCVRVDRDASGLIRTTPLLARVGERAAIQVIDVDAAAPRRGTRRSAAAWSVLVQTGNDARTGGLWIEGSKGSRPSAVGEADLDLPEGAAGVWQIHAASPRTARAAPRVDGAMLVVPRVLPRLRATVAGGRAAPRGRIDVDLALTDGKGRGLPGTVAAVVVDLHGGGSVRGLSALDTRARLCRVAGVETMGPGARCDRFLEGDSALDPLRRAILGARTRSGSAPDNDPGGSARKSLDEAFGAVLRSLEGAVFEASESPERLRDVRRRGAGGAWQFNPELMTLVTAAMDAPPRTPGGEPLALADLLAIDRQVTFDNVARRITRLKLFRILSWVREFKRERQLDPDEPALRDPDALLRRLVRAGRIEESYLIDPWGGTIGFVKSGAAPLPFLTVTRGFALQAPGPDGRLGTGDDVRDPFQRVLRSGTPYARAVSEDRLVDARLDMEVSDATVSAWETLMQELTGSQLGGLGLSGVGEGGGGRGEGIGLGSIGTIGHGARGRGSSAMPKGVEYWSPPRRTDKDGRLRMSIPLGDVETTWRVAFVGAPDGATPATTTVDVPVSLPLSVRVDSGAAWIEGDQVSVAVTVRNRSPRPVRAALSFAARGAAAIVNGQRARSTVNVAAGGVSVAWVWLKAASPGRAELVANVSAPGLPGDAVTHTWDVRPAGEPTDLTNAQWIDETASAASTEGAAGATLRVPFPLRSMRRAGSARVVLERGVDRALEAALDAMNPDYLRSPGAMADAIEVAARVGRWATARRGEASPTALRAAEIARRAVGRLIVYAEQRKKRTATFWEAEQRARANAPAKLIEDLPRDEGSCPPKDLPLDDALDALDAEPAPAGGAADACWDVFVTETTSAAIHTGNRVFVARALLSLAERPHRASIATSLADRLRAWVKLRPSGGITLPDHQARDRASRAIVYAALIRAAGLGAGRRPSARKTDRLLAWLGVQRDLHGGYGGARATRMAVRALLTQADERPAATRVTVIAGGTRREVEVGPAARVVVPLGPADTTAEITASGPGLIARLERPALRLWSSPPSAASSPVHLEVTWPRRPRTGKTGVLEVSLRHSLDRPVVVDVRVPLPPGVSLAEPVDGVRQVQGTLVIRADLDAGRLPTVLAIPLRFALAGRMTAPEARARVAFEDLPRAIAPARPVRIE